MRSWGKTFAAVLALLPVLARADPVTLPQVQSATALAALPIGAATSYAFVHRTDLGVDFKYSVSTCGAPGTYQVAPNSGGGCWVAVASPWPLANGGTGATTASAARTNLGLAIGTNVEAWSANLDGYSSKVPPAGTVVGTTDTQILSNKTLTSPIVTGAFTATGLVTNADLVNAATTVNGQTCTLGSTCTITAAAASLAPGTTTLSPSTSGRVLYDNAGVLGELATTGTGSAVLSASPTFTGTATLAAMTATGLFTLNTGTFAVRGSYTGLAPTQGLIDVLGSTSGYVTGQAPVIAAQKYTSDTTTSGINSAIYGYIESSVSGASVRATGGFFEANLTAAASGNFGEGIRSHCLVTASTSGAACDGGVFYAQGGTGSGNGMFGVEGQVSLNNADTTSTTFLNGTQFNGTFIASPNGPHVLGAAYIINPNDNPANPSAATNFLYGLALPINAGNVHNPIVSLAMIYNAQATAYMIDARTAATGSNLIALPNNSQFLINDSGGTQRNMVALNGSNVAQYAVDAGITSVSLGSAATVTVGTGATNNFLIENAGTYNEILFGNNVNIQGGGGTDKQMYLVTGASGSFDFKINSVDQVILQPNEFQPVTTNVFALGDSTHLFSDVRTTLLHLGGAVTFAASATGAVTPAFTNAPTGCSTVQWIGPFVVTSPSASNVYLASCHT